MPFSADTIAAQKVQEHLKSLYQMVHEVEKKRQQSDQGINNIIKFQTGQDEKSSQHYQVNNTVTVIALQMHDIHKKCSNMFQKNSSNWGVSTFFGLVLALKIHLWV
jgi:hypothetical protein